MLDITHEFTYMSCAKPEIFVRGGQNLTIFDVEGREDRNTTLSGPSLARIYMAFRWHADDGHTLKAGLVAL